MTTTATTTLTDFLLARIAEDEEAARDAHYDGQAWIPEEESVVAADRDLEPLLYLDRKRDATHASRWSPARVLAECEAKRRAVEWCGETEKVYMPQVRRLGDVNAYHPEEFVDGRLKHPADSVVLRYLALPYADHPDYREEWRP